MQSPNGSFTESIQHFVPFLVHAAWASTTATLYVMQKMFL